MKIPRNLRSVFTHWRSASTASNRRLYFHAAFGLIVMAVLTAMLMVGPLFVSNAQEKTAESYSEASSLNEAFRFGMPEAVKATKAPDDNIFDSPEGSVCNWTASTVFPVTALDQASATVGGTLYVFGGVAVGVITANSYKFDGTTWTAIAPLPAALEFPTAVTNGSDIYILGGALTGTGTPQTTLYRYNVALDTYTTLAPFVTGTWNAAAVYLGGKIYKFAGTGPATASNNVLEIYDVTSNTWSPGAAYPLLISFVGAFTKGGFVYGAGGIQSVGSVASLKTYRYDPVGNTWDDAAITDLPATRWGAASSITGYGVNNGWVLAGGYVAGTATANISTSVIRWNSTSNVWDTLSSMTGERARMTGSILGSSFYVVGGRSIASSGFVGTNDNQKLFCISGVAVPAAGPAALVSESFTPANGVPDPGETVTVSLGIHNDGDVATTNLTATLQATGGVTSPSGPQNYGALPPFGGDTTRNFTFTVAPGVICGDSITLTWVINDGATPYPNIVKTFGTGTPVVVTENFDSVAPPAFPAGWTTTQDVGTEIIWTTTATGPNSAPNSAFANDPATVNMSTLTSPSYMITTANSKLSFKNKYITEATFDGMVLEISIGGGAFDDIITLGGSFVSGGYTGVISSSFMSPISGRMAWSGTSAGGYIDTVVNLPAAANGQMVQFRWRMASDSSVTATGVNIDDVQVQNGFTCATGSAPGSISGTITYGNAIGSPAPPRFVRNVSLSSTAGSPPVGPIITGTPGTYALTGFGAGSYTIKPTKAGGPNQSISSADASRIAQGSTGAVPFVSNNQRFAADTSGNGVISSADASRVAQFVTGLPVTTPQFMGQWRFFISDLPAFPNVPAHPQERTYASVTSVLTGEDYIGLLIGETTGNYNPASHARPVGSRQLAVGSEQRVEGSGPVRGIEVQLPQVMALTDKEIVVPVNVQGAADKEIFSYEFDLRYDPTVIQPLVEPVDVAGTASRGLMVVANPYEPGLLRVAVYGVYPIDENGVLLNFRFTAVGAPGTVSPLTFERIMFNEGEPEVMVSDGKLEISY